MTLTIPFPQDNLTQIYIAREENRKRAEGNCLKLLKYWQGNNRHLSKYDAMELLGVDCLAQRVANLRTMGVPVESETRRDLKEPFARYYLKCTCPGDCFLHSKHLQL